MDKGLDPQEERLRIRKEAQAKAFSEAQKGTLSQLLQNYLTYLRNERSVETAQKVAQTFDKDIPKHEGSKRYPRIS